MRKAVLFLSLLFLFISLFGLLSLIYARERVVLFIETRILAQGFFPGAAVEDLIAVILVLNFLILCLAAGVLIRVLLLDAFKRILRGDEDEK